MVLLLVLLCIVLHFLQGYGLLRLLKVSRRLAFCEQVLLSSILGIGLSSVGVFVLELVRIPLSFGSLLIAQLLLAGTAFIDRKSLFELRNRFKYDLKVYEILPLLVVLGFSLISIWRCYYYPPYSYDSKMGIDLVAKYALLDGHINGKLFQDFLPYSNSVSNQLFYAPLTMLNQVLYRGLGIDFGQVWLGLLGLYFLLFFYVKARQYVHPILASVGVLLLLFVPEFFAYSFILQTDYACAVFFFLGVIYLYEYSSKKKKPYRLWISAMAFGLATWTRTETLFFLPLGALYLLFIERKKKPLFSVSLIKNVVYLFIPAVISIVLWNIIFLKFYIPELRDLSDEFSPVVHGVFGQLSDALSKMYTVVLSRSIYWNYLPSVFGIFVVAQTVYGFYKNKWNGFYYVYWFVGMYLIFALLIVEFPAVSVQNTFRRGFFKMIPLMAFFIATGSVAIALSDWLTKWEKK